MNRDALFAEYGAYHRDPRNRLCHEIGIPLIVLAIEALLRLVHLMGPLDLAALVTLTVIAYYVRLAGALATPAAVGLIALYAIGLFVAWPIAVTCFVVGWMLQFVGHAFERKSPAFLTNLLHLLVGPLLVASLLVRSSTSSSSAR